MPPPAGIDPRSLDEEEDLRIDESAGHALPELGSVLGAYRLLRLIGQGGMGVVYEAVHERTGGRRALKIIAPAMASSVLHRARFHREAILAERLHHPGLVHVLDLGELPDQTLYLAMEYLDGKTLRAVLAERGGQRLPLSDVRCWGLQLAAALQAAHAAGIVHRDIKPENIMLVSDTASATGVAVKLLDFGIAKLVGDRDPAVFYSRGRLGTRAYMAPEQAVPGEVEVTGKSDVYSLGVVLYELLTGQAPFADAAGDTHQNIAKIQNQDPPDLVSLRPELPAALCRLVSKMLHKSPGRRPTMAQVAELLSQVPPRRRAGPPLAWFTIMVVLLLILVVLEAYSYIQYNAWWWPGQRPESLMVRIPGVEFEMGSSPAEVEDTVLWAAKWCPTCNRSLYERELPRHKVALNSFFIDRTEVTNAAYVRWLNRQPDLAIVSSGETGRFVYQHAVLLLSLASEEKPAEQSYVGIEGVPGRFRSRQGMARKPVVYISRDGAQQYCQSRGMRLPTEAEWELAARGVQRRRFPWGEDDPGCKQSVFSRKKSGLRCSNEPFGPVDVAATPGDQTPEGVYDLGGNVAEWTLDFFRDRYPICREGFCRSPVINAESALAGESGLHVVRGGSWYEELDACRGAARSRRESRMVTGDIGFRCVKPLSLSSEEKP